MVPHSKSPAVAVEKALELVQNLSQERNGVAYRKPLRIFLTRPMRSCRDCSRIPNCSYPAVQNRHRRYCSTAVQVPPDRYIPDARTFSWWSD